jgi:hypothetical protein
MDSAAVARREGNVEREARDRPVGIEDRVHLTMDDAAVFDLPFGVERVVIRHAARETVVADGGDGEVRTDDHCTDFRRGVF